MGVVSRRWVWVESMGVASGCGCKEVQCILAYPNLAYPNLVYPNFVCSGSDVIIIVKNNFL